MKKPPPQEAEEALESSDDHDRDHVSRYQPIARPTGAVDPITARYRSD